jgi:hypothetical protein
VWSVGGFIYTQHGIGQAIPVGASISQIAASGVKVVERSLGDT